MWDRCTVRDIYNLGYGAETKCGTDVQIVTNTTYIMGQKLNVGQMYR
jgi:hypothetical protein